MYINNLVCLFIGPHSAPWVNFPEAVNFFHRSCFFRPLDILCFVTGPSWFTFESGVRGTFRNIKVSFKPILRAKEFKNYQLCCLLSNLRRKQYCSTGQDLVQQYWDLIQIVGDWEFNTSGLMLDLSQKFFNSFDEDFRLNFLSYGRFSQGAYL